MVENKRQYGAVKKTFLYYSLNLNQELSLWHTYMVRHLITNPSPAQLTFCRACSRCLGYSLKSAFQKTVIRADAVKVCFRSPALDYR